MNYHYSRGSACRMTIPYCGTLRPNDHLLLSLGLDSARGYFQLFGEN